MARYHHLTIFQKSYDLLIRIYREVHNFPREYKFSLGGKLQETCMEVLDNIIMANSMKDKAPAINMVKSNLDRLMIYVRVCNSLHVISDRKYAVLAEKIDEVGRMAGGWLKVHGGSAFKMS